MTADRASLRLQLRRQRAGLDPVRRAAEQAGMHSRLAELVQALRPQRIAGYLAAGSELSITQALQAAALAGIEVYLPRVTVAARSMQFVRWSGLDRELRPGPFGIAEPIGSTTCAARDLDCVLVPGLAFDQHGMRLGSGAGYYDRAFAFRRGTPPPPLLVGVCFAMQCVADLPAAAWDVPMDRLLHAGVVS